MESIGDILGKIGTSISKAGTDILSNANDELGTGSSAGCPVCKGAGFVHPLLPSGHADFSRVVPCRCNKGESEEERRERLREESGDLKLKLLCSMTFASFDCRRANLSSEEQENLQKAYNMARNWAEAPDGWLVLLGPNGCGKTHLAAAIGNYQLEKGKPIFFKVVIDLLDHLRATFSPESNVTYDELLDRVRTAPLLILDDFGEQATTPWAQEKLYQVINYRYNARLPTVITTCLALEEIETRMGSRLCDPRVSTTYNINVPDYRSDLAPIKAMRKQTQRVRRTR